jgi:hypothetical protein
VQWLSQEENDEYSPLHSVPSLFKKILTVFRQTAVFVSNKSAQLNLKPQLTDRGTGNVLLGQGHR